MGQLANKIDFKVVFLVKNANPKWQSPSPEF